MTVLSFSLAPEATGRFHDALVCLAKFGECVSLEARKDKGSRRSTSKELSLIVRQLTITALNLSKTAYAAFALDARTFFIDYHFSASSSAETGDRFTCQLLNKVRIPARGMIL